MTETLCEFRYAGVQGSKRPENSAKLVVDCLNSTIGHQPLNNPSSTNAHNYWAANLRVVAMLLTVWFITSFVISIYFIDVFNSIKIGSLGLGFWFAQQGSIFVFVVLVLIYALGMDVIDRRYHVDHARPLDEEIASSENGDAQ